MAALFVERGGVYWDLPGVEAWDEARDARLYAGPWPVVAHPPCQRWGRYWSGGPNPNAKRRELGDDGGCFAAALHSVRIHGGVLEHPADTKAWAFFGLARPFIGVWRQQLFHEPGGRAWVTEVAQGSYGHRARKLTWLLYVGANPPPDLNWLLPERPARLDMGPHSKEEAKRWRAEGRKVTGRLTTRENLATPIPFRDLLLSIARSAHARSAA